MNNEASIGPQDAPIPFITDIVELADTISSFSIKSFICAIEIE